MDKIFYKIKNNYKKLSNFKNEIERIKSGEK